MRKYIAIIILCFTVLHAVKSQGYTGYTHCSEQDSLALVALYNATDGPHWTSNSDTFNIKNIGSDGDYGSGLITTFPYAGTGKWLKGPVKDWFGVVLEKQPIGTTADSVWRVIYITPVLGRRANGNDNIKGYIPKEVGLLTALKWFRLNGNSGLAKTELPDEIYHPSLIELDLENCLMGGIISSSFRKCTNIEMVNLRYNSWDSVPTFDFLTPDHLLNHMNSFIFLYSTQISYANWEHSLDYFTSFTTIPTVKYQVQNLSNVGREQEIVAKPGDTVTLTCNDAGKQGTCTWLKKGINTYKIATTYTINNIAAKDTGKYNGSLLNPYIAQWQLEGNSGVSTVLTKPIHVVFTPATPVCNSFKTSYSGNELILTFSKPMTVPKASQASLFSVSRNGANMNITGIKRTGRLNDTYILSLGSSILKGDSITISYAKSAGDSVVDRNSGVLLPFNGKAVQNLTRKTPSVINNAITRKDGAGIIVSFDQYIDPSTLVASDFTITQSDDPAQQVAAVTLKPGELDDTISKAIQLVVTNSIFDTTSVITVSYKKGSMTALYGGAVQSFSPIPVKNVSSGKATTVTLHFVDLCGKYKNIYVKGSVKVLPFKLYDDKTNGDVTANDHNWTKNIKLGNSSYTWAVYQRTILAYDTVITTNEITGVQNIVITPKPGATIDSLLSSVMNVIVSDTIIGSDTVSIVKGDTIAYICNKSLDIILDMKAYAQHNPGKAIAPYLMGIDGDWKNGIAMNKIKDPVTGDSVYSVKFSNINSGDIFNFSFRNGAYPSGDWENISPQTRSYTIIDNDTIRLQFGVFVTSISTDMQGISVYPNPVHNLLFISTNHVDVFGVRVYNMFGQCVVSTNAMVSSVDVSQLTEGMYVLEMRLSNGSINRIHFIKK